MTGAMIAGILIYVLGVLLSAIMLAKTARNSLVSLFAKSSEEHHAVLRVLRKHPKGGSWREFREWWALREE